MVDIEIPIDECCSYCEAEPECSADDVGNVCAGHAWLFSLRPSQLWRYKMLRRLNLPVPVRL